MSIRLVTGLRHWVAGKQRPASPRTTAAAAATTITATLATTATTATTGSSPFPRRTVSCCQYCLLSNQRRPVPCMCREGLRAPACPIRIVSRRCLLLCSRPRASRLVLFASNSPAVQAPNDTRTAHAQSSAQTRRVAKACGEAIQQHKTPIACLNPLKSGRTMKRTNHPYTLVIVPVATPFQLSSDSFPWPNRLPSYLPYPACYPLRALNPTVRVPCCDFTLLLLPFSRPVVVMTLASLVSVRLVRLLCHLPRAHCFFYRLAAPGLLAVPAWLLVC